MLPLEPDRFFDVLSRFFERSLGLLMATAILTGCVKATASLKPGDAVSEIHVPEGFKVSVFAGPLEDARSMALGDDGTIYIGSRDAGNVYAVRDINADGIADESRVLVKDMIFPNGLAFLRGDLYIADMTGIRRVPAAQLHATTPVVPLTVFEGFPAKKHHGWKYLKAGPDGKLYLAVGVPCNICQPEGPYEGRLLRMDPSDPKPEVLAEGLRNSVGLTFGNQGDLWLTDNGRDWLGDTLPPDELNHWVKAGTHYGYPECYGAKGIDPDFGREGLCQQRTPPAWEFPAHMAPLGLLFYQGTAFPESYRHQLLVAQHGSWNRSAPHGYRVVMLKYKKGLPVSEQVFAEGWLKSDGTVIGRPVDLLELKDGSLLVSDDYSGLIYRISVSSSHSNDAAP
ncbi:MAG: hypothetical protein RLZ25_712 [Pseudomonadota bacterium]|jgi:glucose/arabinose dehydrogenase